MIGNSLELAIAAANFTRDFPGWWWTVGQDEYGAHASCAPFGRGCDRGLLHHIDGDDPLDTGFHVSRMKTPHEALRAVTRQAHEYLETAE